MKSALAKRADDIDQISNAHNFPCSTLDQPNSPSLGRSTATNLPNLGSIQDPVDIRCANQQSTHHVAKFSRFIGNYVNSDLAENISLRAAEARIL
jgi:hypothetical protein